MIDSDLIKEVIKINEYFIKEEVKNIVSRDNLTFPLKLRKVKIIYGVRRSGKTFILYDLFKKNINNSLYIDFEDERLIGTKVSDLEKFKDSFFELNPHLIKSKKVFFLFDEIHNVNGWERFARRVVERENIDLYIAGSSSQITPLRIHTSLRGRVWATEVYPFSFKELLKTKNLDVKNAVYGSDKSIIKNYLNEYLRWGGFPEICFLDLVFEKNKVLREYIEAMFFRDLVEKFNIKNINLLQVLYETLFSSYSIKFSLSSFYKKQKDSFPFSKDSLFSYYKNFLESMLIYETRIFSTSSYRRMRNPPKIYLTDTGLAKRVKSEDFGRLLENAVFLELKRRGYEIYYFDENGECDFIAKKGDKLETIQVSWTIRDENKERELKGIIQACKSLRINKGTIITRDQKFEEKKENIAIKVVPFWKWALTPAS